MKTNHSQSQGLPFIKISSNIPSPCKITITATGTAAEVAADYLGSYVSTEEWSEGRRTFKPEERGENKERLQVEYGRWRFGIELGSVESGCAPSLCPADPRVPRNYTSDWEGMDGQTSGWGFIARIDELGRFEYEEGEIVVSCSVHNHNDEELADELGRLVAAEEARVAAEMATSREMAQDTRLKAVESDERLQTVEVAGGDFGEEGDGSQTEEVRREDEETQPIL